MRPGGKAATAATTTRTRTFSSVAQAFSPARIVANEVQGQVGTGGQLAGDTPWGQAVHDSRNGMTTDPRRMPSMTIEAIQLDHFKRLARRQFARHSSASSAQFSQNKFPPTVQFSC